MTYLGPIKEVGAGLGEPKFTCLGKVSSADTGMTCLSCTLVLLVFDWGTEILMS